MAREFTPRLCAEDRLEVGLQPPGHPAGRGWLSRKALHGGDLSLADRVRCSANGTHMPHRPVCSRRGEIRMESSLKVLIADDHPLILNGIRSALEASEDIAVVGQAHS